MELVVQKREKFGKQNKALRDAELIPAELYGRGKENIHVAVPVKDFLKAYKDAGENTVINVMVEGEMKPALIYNVQFNPVTDHVVHVDFYEVRMDEKIKAHIPIEFMGVAPGVKEKNGVLVKAMHEIEVESLPGNLPHKLEVDISGLMDINSSFYVKDLKPLPGVEFLAEPETVIASINAKLTEEEEAAMAAPKTVDEVKVETEEEKAKREAEKAEAGEVPVTGAPVAKKEEGKK